MVPASNKSAAYSNPPAMPPPGCSAKASVRSNLAVTGAWPTGSSRNPARPGCGGSTGSSATMAWISGVLEAVRAAPTASTTRSNGAS